ncbi:TonB-dependent receptor [Polynucleobacter sp. 15G-AUS-farblos]|uniref:TonB-dependent receptor n=1 Tax=Polynucleobacter sp. 15G-AUS-farblos TaxID=2689094 RepID=UPI001C0AA744|nr:TonB-dependent receptor [Polynucleobacter sp. 15G-AUS-farblos]MBU3583264.1 TonB-dependent receptor [Polynucleobacter sp. 15G-AUS-farblos]
MSFKQKKISACIGILFGSLCIGAQAQIAPPPDYDQKLKSVTVSATRSGTPLDEIPLNTTILTKEALEVSPDQTIDQILKNVPGVILNDTPYYQKDPTGQSINVRGLGNARTLVLIDGLPANDAFYGTVQWNLVPMSAIDSVEFIRGGVSSLWGNYSMGGVINIKTKTPVNSQQEASASIGSFGTYNVAASKDIIASDNLQLRLSADYFNTDGYQNISTISPAASNSIRNGQGPASSHNSNFRLQGYFKATQDTSGFFRAGYHTMSDLSSGYAFATNLKQDTDIAAGTTTRLEDRARLDANLFYSNTNFNKQNGSTTNTRSNNIAANTPYISANYKDPYNTVGASAQYTKELTGVINQYLIGVDARNIAGSNLTNNLNNNGTVSNINYSEGQQTFLGLMGQVKARASSIPLETTLAARVDQWSSQTPTAYNTGPNGANPTYQNIPNQSKTQLSPTLGFLYKATSNWDLRTAAYQAFRAPGLNNTLRSFGSSSGFSFANPNLTPETMIGYEVGTDYRWKGGFAQVTAFNNYIQNAVATYSLSARSSTDVALAKSLCGATGNPLTGTGNRGICNSTNISYYTNNQNLLSQGLEFQFHHDINSKWATDANYAFTSTKLTMSATSDPTGKQVGGVPQNILGGGITYYPIPDASFTATVRYVGSSWLNTANTLPVASYAVVGLRANYQASKNTTIYASAVNLFNRQYNTFGTGGSNTSYVVGSPQAINVGARIIF